MVVTISRQMGSGGAVVGQALAQRLGLRYADRDILAAAARSLGVEAADLEPIEEHLETYWERVAHMFALGSVDTVYAPLTPPTVDESVLFTTERRIIESIAARGNAVIVGRGAAQVLSGRADLVRVFLHAPLAVRVARARKEHGMNDEHKAAEVVRRSDQQRARFVRSLTGRDWCDATLSDLSLNTEAVGLAAAVEVTINFVERMQDSSPEAGRRCVSTEIL
jgi:cytidylate kinase